MNFTDWTNGGGQDKMVWVANRGKPLRGTLNISHDGNLMLTDYNGTFITINAEEQAVPSNDTSTTLFDTGNLVLRAGKHIVWQSFDYPSDTWLPGMKLGLFKSSRGQPQHRFLTSQVSQQVPTLGAFTLGVDPNNTKQLVIWQRGVLYWRSGMWNGYNFSYFPNGYDEFNFSYFSNESQSYFTFTRVDNDFPSWIDIDSSGNIRVSKTEDNGWSLASYYCYDSQGLENSNNFGCVAPNPSNCTAGDVFIKKSGSTDSSIITNNVSQGISDCKEICKQDCACTGYASALSDGSGCQFFLGEYSDSPEYIFYIRNISKANIASPLVPPSYMAPHNPNNLFPNDHNNTTPVNSRKKRLWFTISAAISLVIFTLVSSLSYLWWRNRHSRRNNRSEDRTSLGTQSFMSEMKTEATIMEKINNGKKDQELPLFSLSSIEIATDYFSDANKIGQGGFGPVYKVAYDFFF
ncbi:G-type lectin S-receptor-like serine/threonine-protein kinase [Camellia lanceoleosa]|uniref:G-type lectin S-receptor-like serine/threonine-protein kinase n=1 Tax=Camellia lanceoleosa TaxID=1840588 RepID=A0ACC0FJ81_9ERIC|nr:G-type lectin S-receptor-like serine/threonine-protein kinase [Camellia lanceoleosa]